MLKKVGRPKKVVEEAVVIKAATPKITAVKPAHQLAPVAERKATLRVLINKYNEGAEHKVMAFANEVVNTFELRRPSGIMQLDADTGGGLPAGCISEISGPYGAGKTFLALCYCLMHQKLYGEQAFIAYACAEGAFDYRRAVNIGLKISIPDEIIDQWNQERIQRNMVPYTQEEYASFKEKQGEFVIIRGNTGEEIMGGVLESVRSSLFGLIIVDSMSTLLPDADADKDLDENNKKAAQATLVTNFINKVLPSFNGLDGLNYTTLLCLNQVRSNQERANAPSHMQKYIKQWASTGSFAAKHAKHIDVTVWSGEKLRKTIKGKDRIIGKVTKYELTKGKTGAHENTVGEFEFFYDNYLPPGVDHLETVIQTGLSLGVIVERNGKISVLRPEDGKPTDIVNITGMPTFKAMMGADFEFELAVRREVLAAKGIMCLYR